MLPIFGYVVNPARHRSSSAARRVRRLGRQPQAHRRRNHRPRRRTGAAASLKDAERDAETRKKEALLDAKEKAHEHPDGGRAPGARRSASRRPTLEQTLTRREAALAERQAAIERLEKELRGARARASSEREKARGRRGREVRAARRAAAARARARRRPDGRRGEGAAASSRSRATRATTRPTC